MIATLVETAARTFGLIVADADLDAARALALPAGVELFALSRITAAVVQRDASGRAVAVEPPAGLLGCLALSPEGTAALDAVSEDLALVFDPGVPDVFDVQRRGAEVVLPWLAERLAEQGGERLRDAAQLRRALATLRREHGDMLVRFAELEGAAATWATPTRVRRLHYPASRAQAAIGQGRRLPRGLRQTLPASPSGLAAIELTVAEARGDGVLTVALHVGGDTEPAGVWRFPAGALHPGRLRLLLDRALTRTAIEVSLTAAFEGAGQAVLALSGATPLDEYAAVTDAGVNLGAPLAVTLWTLPPGLPVRQAAFDAEPEARPTVAPPSPARFALAADELASVERLLPEEDAVGYKLVRYRPDERDVLVHPVTGETTVAVLRDVPIRAARELSALVVLDNRGSAPVEVGLAVVPSRPTHVDPVRWITRWTVVEPMVHVEVPGDVAPDATGSVDLLLATRMADGADAHLAWLYFRRVAVVA